MVPKERNRRIRVRICGGRITCTACLRKVTDATLLGHDRPLCTDCWNAQGDETVHKGGEARAVRAST